MMLVLPMKQFVAVFGSKMLGELTRPLEELMTEA